MWRNLLCALAALLAVTARAQTYRFDDVPVPESKSLVMRDVFFVLAKEGSEGDHSKISFLDLKATSSSISRADFTLRDYGGIQLHLMRYADFETRINPEKMCSTPDDVAKGLAEKEDQLLINKESGKSLDDVQVYSYPVHFYGLRDKSHKDLEKAITQSGVYVLVLSNCGIYDRAVLSGSVTLKNAHGWLPGTEFLKMRFFGYLGVLYLVLFVAWAFLCLRWYSVISRFHIYILSVIAIGLAECVLCRNVLSDWNSTGLKTDEMLRPLVFLSATRTTSSYMLVLMACLGWGMTLPALDSSTTCKMMLLAVSYTVLNSIREIMSSSREGLSTNFMLLCFAPLSLLHGGIFYWIFSALSSLMDNLTMGQAEALSVFTKLWRVLVCAVVFALFAVLVQVLVFSKNPAAYWHESWMVTDCAPHAVFGCVLLVIMVLWAPGEDSQQIQFMPVAGNEKGDKVAPGGDSSIWTDEVMEGGNDEDETFWASTRSRAQPEVVGNRQPHVALE